MESVLAERKVETVMQPKCFPYFWDDVSFASDIWFIGEVLGRLHALGAIA
jgi:hypothetical protein